MDTTPLCCLTLDLQYSWIFQHNCCAVGSQPAEEPRGRREGETRDRRWGGTESCRKRTPLWTPQTLWPHFSYPTCKYQVQITLQDSSKVCTYSYCTYSCCRRFPMRKRQWGFWCRSQVMGRHNTSKGGFRHPSYKLGLKPCWLGYFQWDRPCE